MINEDNCIVIDLDGCICQNKKADESYESIKPNEKVVKKLREYRKEKFYIIIYSSRNMRTFGGNLGKINAVTLKIILEWLDKHNVPYDEIHVGKPWCGRGGFYVDDKSIRPDEFINKSKEEIYRLIGK